MLYRGEPLNIRRFERDLIFLIGRLIIHLTSWNYERGQGKGRLSHDCWTLLHTRNYVRGYKHFVGLMFRLLHDTPTDSSVTSGSDE